MANYKIWTDLEHTQKALSKIEDSINYLKDGLKNNTDQLNIYPHQKADGSWGLFIIQINLNWSISKSYSAFYISPFKPEIIPEQVKALVKELTNLDTLKIILGEQTKHKGQSGVYLIFYLRELIRDHWDNKKSLNNEWEKGLKDLFLSKDIYDFREYWKNKIISKGGKWCIDSRIEKWKNEISQYSLEIENNLQFFKNNFFSDYENLTKLFKEKYDLDLNFGSGNLINLSEFEKNYENLKNQELENDKLKDLASSWQNLLSSMKSTSLSDNDPNHSVKLITKLEKVNNILDNWGKLKGFQVELNLDNLQELVFENNLVSELKKINPARQKQYCKPLIKRKIISELLNWKIENFNWEVFDFYQKIENRLKSFFNETSFSDNYAEILTIQLRQKVFSNLAKILTLESEIIQKKSSEIENLLNNYLTIEDLNKKKEKSEILKNLILQIWNNYLFLIKVLPNSTKIELFSNIIKSEFDPSIMSVSGGGEETESEENIPILFFTPYVASWNEKEKEWKVIIPATGMLWDIEKKFLIEAEFQPIKITYLEFEHIGERLPISTSGIKNIEIQVGQIPKGSALKTRSGNLTIQGINDIIHVASGSITQVGNGIPTRQAIILSLQNAVLLSERETNNSLAIPFVGGDIFLKSIGGTKEQLAEAIIKSVVSQSKSLNKIVFVPYGNENKIIFEKVWEQAKDKFSTKKTDLVQIKEGDICLYSTHECQTIINASNMEVIFGSGLAGKIGHATGEAKTIEKEARQLINCFNERYNEPKIIKVSYPALNETKKYVLHIIKPPLITFNKLSLEIFPRLSFELPDEFYNLPVGRIILHQYKSKDFPIGKNFPILNQDQIIELQITNKLIDPHNSSSIANLGFGSEWLDHNDWTRYREIYILSDWEITAHYSPNYPSGWLSLSKFIAKLKNDVDNYLTPTPIGNLTNNWKEYWQIFKEDLGLYYDKLSELIGDLEPILSQVKKIEAKEIVDVTNRRQEIIKELEPILEKLKVKQQIKNSIGQIYQHWENNSTGNLIDGRTLEDILDTAKENWKEILEDLITESEIESKVKEFIALIDTAKLEAEKKKTPPLNIENFFESLTQTLTDHIEGRIIILDSVWETFWKNVAQDFNQFKKGEREENIQLLITTLKSNSKWDSGDYKEPKDKTIEALIKLNSDTTEDEEEIPFPLEDETKPKTTPNWLDVLNEIANWTRTNSSPIARQIETIENKYTDYQSEMSEEDKIQWKKLGEKGLKEIRKFGLDLKNKYTDPLQGLDLSKPASRKELLKSSNRPSISHFTDDKLTTEKGLKAGIGDFAKFNNYIALDTVGDGNCFLNAFSVLFTGNARDTTWALPLRAKLCLEIINNPNLTDEASATDTFLEIEMKLLRGAKASDKGFAVNGKWLATDDIVYIAQIISRPIGVIVTNLNFMKESTGGIAYTLVGTVEEKDLGLKYPEIFYVGHTGGVHFEAVVPPEEHEEGFIEFVAGNEKDDIQISESEKAIYFYNVKNIKHFGFSEKNTQYIKTKKIDKMQDIIFYFSEAEMSTEKFKEGKFTSLKEILHGGDDEPWVNKQGCKFLINVNMTKGYTLDNPYYGLRIESSYGKGGQIYLSDTTYNGVNIKKI